MPPPPELYGPTLTAPVVRTNTAPAAVTIFSGVPGVDYTQLNPLNSQVTNQAAITNDTTGKVWFPSGTYSCTSAYSLNANTEYRLQSIAGYTRTASDSAVIDGGGRSINALVMSPSINVTIKGGLWQNQGNASAPGYAGILHNGGSTKGGWVVEDAIITTCAAVGLRFQGPNCTARRVYAHTNGRYGMAISENAAGDPVWTGMVVENCRIANNNTLHFNVGGDAGGTKFLECEIICRNNWAHDNYGSGLWFDTSLTNSLIEDNVCEDNRNWGIFYERSFGGTFIRRNALYDNAFGTPTDPLNPEAPDWYRAVQLLISCSDGTLGLGTGIDVSRNIIDGSTRAIGLVQHGVHPWDCRDIDFHHNQLWLRNTAQLGDDSAQFGAQVGGFDVEVPKILWTVTPPITFDYNEYHVGNLATKYWKWDSGTGGGVPKTWAQWQAYGHDPNGSVVVI